MLQLQDWLEQIAEFLHPLECGFIVETEELRIFLAQALLHLVPGDRGRDHGTLLRAQRIHPNRGLVIDVLAPVDKDLSGAEDLLHLGDDAFRMLPLQHARELVREWFGLLVCSRRVQRDIDLQSF